MRNDRNYKGTAHGLKLTKTIILQRPGKDSRIRAIIQNRLSKPFLTVVFSFEELFNKRVPIGGRIRFNVPFGNNPGAEDFCVPGISDCLVVSFRSFEFGDSRSSNLILVQELFLDPDQL